MATVRYSLQVTIEQPRETKSLPLTDKETLFRRPEFQARKARQAGEVVRSEMEESPQEESLSLIEISQGYTELIDKANDLLKILRNRVGELTYEFSPQDRPDLAQAIADTFVGENARITYTMYLNSLQMDKNLSIAIGENSHGIV